jgi:ADP-ribose pyrophosphatase YjhB (NUDIX family)
MIVRRCAGGVVFYANKVLLLKNDRGEWTLPKGKIHADELLHESAIRKVQEESGLNATVIEMAGDTMYEFYSRSRQQDVCNAIMWYIMESDDTDCQIKDEFSDGGFFRVIDAMDMLTHEKEKSLVDLSYRKYKELKKCSEISCE